MEKNNIKISKKIKTKKLNFFLKKKKISEFMSFTIAGNYLTQR
jgi:hypothetical protein